MPDLPNYELKFFQILSRTKQSEVNAYVHEVNAYVHEVNAYVHEVNAYVHYHCAADL